MCDLKSLMEANNCFSSFGNGKEEEGVEGGVKDGGREDGGVEKGERGGGRDGKGEVRR